MERTRCFFLEPTERDAIQLRRVSVIAKCSNPWGYHTAKVKIGECPSAENRPEGCGVTAESDPQWPTKCDHCGYLFGKDDLKITDHPTLYRRTDTGQEFPLSEAPAGAMWYADWFENGRKGWDGHQLEVKLPDGHVWSPDNRASNCTLPQDDEHRCWVRHGTPPDITVDKQGKTCAAGAGSILSRSGWHGFLRQGWLEKC